MRFVLSLVLLLSLSACDTLFAGDSEPVRIQTDADAYTARVAAHTVEFALAFHYTNVSGRTAYLHGCHGPNPPRIEKRAGEEWAEVYSPVIDLCLSPPTPVRLGETYRYEFAARAGLPGCNCLPEWGADSVEGTYRLLWEVEERGEMRIAVSNEFTLSSEEGD